MSVYNCAQQQIYKSQNAGKQFFTGQNKRKTYIGKVISIYFPECLSHQGIEQNELVDSLCPKMLPLQSERNVRISF